MQRVQTLDIWGWRAGEGVFKKSPRFWSWFFQSPAEQPWAEVLGPLSLFPHLPNASEGCWEDKQENGLSGIIYMLRLSLGSPSGGTQTYASLEMSPPQALILVSVSDC